jgi:lysophospholipase L1-like esterase
MNRSKKIAQNVALLCGSVLFLFLILEVGARLTGVAEPAKLGPDFDRPARDYLPEPGRANPWLKGKRSREVFRLAIIGDSFTYSSHNRKEDGFPARLERLLNLNDDAPPVDVRVYAEPGYSTYQELAFLKKAIRQKSDLILLVVFLNDSEGPRDAEFKRWRKKIQPQLPSPQVAALLRRSHAATWLYQLGARYRSSRNARAYYREFLLDPQYKGWIRFEQAVRKFRESTDEASIPLVAAIFPAMGTLGPAYMHQLGHQRMGAVLDENGIPFLDLLTHFADKSPARMAAVPRLDNHPNEIGHRIAAEALLEWLLSEGHLDEVFRPNRAKNLPLSDWEKKVRRSRSPLAK